MRFCRNRIIVVVCLSTWLAAPALAQDDETPVTPEELRQAHVEMERLAGRLRLMYAVIVVVLVAGVYSWWSGRKQQGRLTGMVRRELDLGERAVELLESIDAQLRRERKP